jgi:hypothetical protein
MKRRIFLGTILGVLLGVALGSAQADVLCKPKAGAGVRVRAACSPGEIRLDPLALGLVGPQGGPGPQGAPGPQGPAGNPAQVFQLVGFTSATYGSDKGVLALGRACQYAFPQSRMCTYEEIIATTNVQVGSAIDGFVVAPVAPSPLGANCLGWSTSDPYYSALTVDSDGKFQNVPCGTQHAVACCASS